MFAARIRSMGAAHWLVLFGLIRFPPAEPMGLAIGVLLVLIAVSFASYRDHLRRREAIQAPKA